jgi:hypothetical protein
MESIHGERGLRKPPPNPQRGWRSQAVTIAALTGMILTGWSLAAVAAGSATTAADVRANHKTDKKPAERWSVERANQWYAKYPWICGCNYVPSTAVNQLEMWQADTFDPKTIDHELGMAESIGLNTVRIFLHDQAWVQDPDGFKKRLSEFLDICQKHHIWALVTFFTNGGRGTPIKIGKQPEPIPGVHNARWLQSPGAAVVNHPEKWAYLEGYVKDILSTYAEDERILCWCLYNEPESTRNGNRCLPLLRTIWRWGRQVDPSQPFTAPIFFLPMHPRTDLPICCFIGENCDVMSFHCYLEPEVVEKMIDMAGSFGRPVLCTEYIARPTNNFFNVTPILKEANVGAIHFGLVNGKCNFHFYGPEDLPEPKHWKHDLFRADGTPFDPEEIEQIRKLTGKQE